MKTSFFNVNLAHSKTAWIVKWDILKQEYKINEVKEFSDL